MACGGCGSVSVAAAKMWLDCFVTSVLSAPRSTEKPWTRKAHAALYERLARGDDGAVLLAAFPGIGNVSDPGWGNDVGRTAQIVAGISRLSDSGMAPFYSCMGLSQADAMGQIDVQVGGYYTALLSAMGQIVASETESQPTGKKALIAGGVLLATVVGVALLD
jgi:hypothetical protein